MPMLLRFCGALALTVTQGLTAAQSGPPQQATPIKLGTSTALTGPSSRLGTGVLAGIQAAIDEANAAGGFGGRLVSITALDDGYEPDRAAPNTRLLIGEHKTVAIIGNVGTPTAVAVLPIVERANVPFIGPFTGAGVLRKQPPDHCVFNLRASYAEETAAMVDHLIAEGGLKPQEIAVFSQRDAYGDAGFAGAAAALKRHGVKDTESIRHARYERNTTAVENAVADILTSDPQPRAVIMIGAYAPCAEFIKHCRKENIQPLFLNVSFVGSAALAEALGPDGDGVVITQVVPHPQSDAPLAVRFRAAMEKRPAEKRNFDYTALEGYADAQVLFAGLKQIKDDPTPQAIIAALDALDRFDIGMGEQLHFAPDSRQASHRVWVSMIRQGKVLPSEWSDLRPPAPPLPAQPAATAGAQP